MTSEVEEDVSEFRELGHAIDEGLELVGVVAVPSTVLRTGKPGMTSVRFSIDNAEKNVKLSTEILTYRPVIICLASPQLTVYGHMAIILI